MALNILGFVDIRGTFGFEKSAEPVAVVLSMVDVRLLMPSFMLPFIVVAVQPPGTPTVGLTFLHAWDLLDDDSGEHDGTDQHQHADRL